MKLIYFKRRFKEYIGILFFFCLFSSCALLDSAKTLRKEPSTKKSFAKKEKSTISSSVLIQAIEKAEKEVFLNPLTKKRAQEIQKLLKTTRKTRLKDRINMLLGLHFFKKSNYKKSLTHYSKVKGGAFKAKGLLAKAQIYRRTGQINKALKELNLLLKKEKSADGDLLLKAYLLKLDLSFKIASQRELLELYCTISIYDQKKNSVYIEKAKDIVFNMAEKEVLNLRTEDFIEPIKDYVFYRTGKIFFHRGNFKKSRLYFKKFLRVASESRLETKALNYIQAIESRKKVNRRNIGAVLPLSGPSAQIGKRVLKGLKLGLGFYEGGPFQLIVIDSKGQADKAQKAVQTLVTKHHVIALTGGVLSRTAEALAEEAQNFGVPILLLSQKSRLTNIGHYVFQNGLTAELIVEQLTEHLVSHLKVKKFAILYPNDAYGVNYANAFWDAVKKKGGVITGAQFYKPGETDFNGPLRRLIGTYYLKDRTKEYKDKLKKWYLKQSSLSKRNTPKNILLPVVDFEVLFIPDSVKILRLIAPHIAYNDIKNIKLAGSPLWNQKVFLKKHLKYMDQLIFVGPGISTKDFKQNEFYKKFQKVFNQKPGLFSALAYESALALHQVIASGADTRGELREYLLNLKSFSGPFGKITISDKREFVRSLPIVKMEKKALSRVFSTL